MKPPDLFDNSLPHKTESFVSGKFYEARTHQAQGTLVVGNKDSDLETKFQENLPWRICLPKKKKAYKY